MSDHHADLIAFLASVEVKPSGTPSFFHGGCTLPVVLRLSLSDKEFDAAFKRQFLTMFPTLAANALRDLTAQLEAQAPNQDDESLCSCPWELVRAQGCQCGGR